MPRAHNRFYTSGGSLRNSRRWSLFAVLDGKISSSCRKPGVLFSTICVGDDQTKQKFRKGTDPGMMNGRETELRARKRNCSTHGMPSTGSTRISKPREHEMTAKAALLRKSSCPSCGLRYVGVT